MEPPPKPIIVEVNSDNINDVWPRLRSDLRECTYIALDAEMSGLGDNSHMYRSNANDRYKSLKAVAETRSLVSIGITCFKLIQDKRSSLNGVGCDSNIQDKLNESHIAGSSAIFYQAKPYNVLLLCCDSFTIDPSAVSFLVKHGFDFNMQFSTGLKYKKGNFTESKSTETNISGRKIFEEILYVRKPLILHNGLTDLVFLYQCFYASCPNKLATFLSDLCEMFPSGIYDTKVIAHFQDKLNSTYLEYVSKSYQTVNANLSSQNKTSVKVVFSDKQTTIEDFIGPCVVQKFTREFDVKVCPKYAKHGWCGAEKCDQSHDVGDVLAQQQYEKDKKRRKRKKNEEKHATGKTSPEAICLSDSVAKVRKHTCHRAGYDSLLTGYAFAVFTLTRSKKCEKLMEASLDLERFSSAIPFFPEETKTSVINRLYLNSKCPLWVTKSHFAKTSEAHNDNILRIFLQ